MNNTIATKKVPELRFPEFEDEWEVIKLGDHADFFKGKGISKKDIVENGINHCIRYGELYTIYKEIIFKKNIVSKTNTSKENSVLSRKNDVIIPSSGETQLDIATASCIQDDDIILGGDLNIIRSIINGAFLAYYLNNKKKKQIAQLAQGNSVVHLYNRNISTLSLNIPSKIEQQKIADFLSQVDKKIELLSQKEAALREYKKGVMQKLFSQEIRFKIKNAAGEFVKPPDWEEKRLGDIGDFRTSSVDKKSFKNQKEVFLINYMDVYNHKTINNTTIKSFQVVTAKASQIKSANISKGDILFTPSSETPTDIGHSVVIFEDINNTVFSYHLIRFRPNQNLNLLYSHYFCNIPRVLKQISKFATGSTRFTISSKNFSEIVVDLPCIEEQTKIANFLSRIDEKIEAVASASLSHRQWKKGLLQKMFV